MTTRLPTSRPPVRAHTNAVPPSPDLALLTLTYAGAGSLRALKYLSVAGNRLEGLGAGLRSLYLLETLDLSRNQLREIEPGDLAQLPFLFTLHLSGNQLSALPASLAQLTSLTDLQADHNQLRAIDADALRGLPHLESLNLSHNQLEQLVLHEQDCTSLTHLEVRGRTLPETSARRRRWGNLPANCTLLAVEQPAG